MSTSEPMAEPAPDPVAQPSEYRDLLLSLAGSDDPASVQRATAGELRDLLTQAGEHGVLRTPPAPGEWSMIELAGHFVDAELVSSARYRWIVAHDTPDIAAYDQDLWVSRLRHREAGPEELLDLFEALRGSNLTMWERIPERERSRYGVHAERGPESYEVMFRMLAGHDRFHLQQARETLAAVSPA
ncbi:MAG TPA: DinB family protein [Actinomycetota bacterium]